jgi:hypothetical protein
MTLENVVFLHIHMLYLFNTICYLYTEQVRPRTNS